MKNTAKEQRKLRDADFERRMQPRMVWPSTQEGTVMRVHAENEEKRAYVHKPIVKKKSGTFQSCVEAGLKQDEGLSGRIAVGWSIVSGVVKDAHVVENTTGNTTLGSCFVTGVRGLRFDAALNAEVPSYTWAVSGQ